MKVIIIFLGFHETSGKRQGSTLFREIKMNLEFAKIVALLGPVIVVPAYAEIYMSSEQAVQLIFPKAKLERADLDLTNAEIQVIESKSGNKVREKKMVVWKNSAQDCVFIDQVLGKHEFITYAVGVTPKGAVKGVEILEYRESYGHEVRNKEWKDQFLGKTSNSTLKLDEDIKNLSGATLSSSHITAGIKRILNTYDTIKHRL